MTKHLYESATEDQDDGLALSDAIQTLEQNGYVLENSWAENTDFRADVPATLVQSAPRLRDASLVELKANTLKAALIEYGPLVIALSWGTNWTKANVPIGGAMNADPGEDWGKHAVSVTGFDDGRASLRIRNSWGSDFGENGYAWMPYASIGAIYACVNVPIA